MPDTDANLPLWLAFLSLSEQATRDWLTGLHNRRYFEETLAEHIEAATRYDRELSLVLFDIDGFKQINDSRGHDAGDLILKQFAETLRTTARKADIVCRYGGDEFAVILPETSDRNAQFFASRVQGELNNLHVSAGIAALPCGNLVAAADADLMSRKEKSRR